MKRKALLAITGCTPKTFETYSARDKLPFMIPSERWSEYSIEDAFALKLLMKAAELTDLDTASKLASAALCQLRPLDPFAFCGDQELFVALIRYDWPDKPDDWDARTVVAGRWQDIEGKVRDRIADIAPSVHLIGMLTLPIKRIADELLVEAEELGLLEGEMHSVPEDLTDYPDWFKEIEFARRRLIFGQNKA